MKLPRGIAAALLDMDGVLTETATVHARAWKEMFDAFLREREGPGFRPFDVEADYDAYVDGKPRYDGVASFLESRGISLPRGSRDDPPSAETIDGLGNRKNEIVGRIIRDEGVRAYPGSVRFLDAAREAGLKLAVVSSSANAHDVLAAAGLAGRFDTVVDGHVVDREGLRGKPAPDTFLAAARKLEVPPASAAVFEDALAGVEAGRAGNFGQVVGVDRVGQAAALREHGADVVVSDLAELVDP